jgi:hypothetical protein
VYRLLIPLRVSIKAIFDERIKTVYFAHTSMEEHKQHEVEDLMRDKMNDWKDKVEGIELEDLRLNIFLAAAMDMDEPEELIEWGVHQHLERSIVTSFGFLIEKMALVVSGGEEHDGEGGDIVMEKDGKKHYIEIKSGTASSNVKMMRNTSNAQAKIKDDNGNEEVVTVLGLTYGKPEEVFSTMDEYYQGDKLLVGQEFWEFLSGDEDAHRDLVEAIVNARNEAFQQENLEDDSPSSLQEAMEQKIDDLSEEWREENGDELTYGTLTDKFF